MKSDTEHIKIDKSCFAFCDHLKDIGWAEDIALEAAIGMATGKRLAFFKSFENLAMECGILLACMNNNDTEHDYASEVIEEFRLWQQGSGMISDDERINRSERIDWPHCYPGDDA